MLPKKHRLKTKKDFQYVYDRGRKKGTQYFLLIAANQKKSAIPLSFVLPRFGFVASAKTGKAAKRNKAKRMLREIIQNELPNLNKDFDAVFICSRSLADTDAQIVKQEVTKAMTSLGLYRAEVETSNSIM